MTSSGEDGTCHLSQKGLLRAPPGLPCAKCNLLLEGNTQHGPQHRIEQALRELYSLPKSLRGRSLGSDVIMPGGGLFPKVIGHVLWGNLGNPAERLQSSPRLGNSESSGLVTAGTFTVSKFQGALQNSPEPGRSPIMLGNSYHSPQGHNPGDRAASFPLLLSKGLGIFT